MSVANWVKQLMQKLEWRFERKRFSQKARDPMQSSFFTNSSIEADAHSLVRELIQNSMDAKQRNAKDPIRVRMKITRYSTRSGVIGRYISSEAWNHYNASDSGLQDVPKPTDDCLVFVYEDFNTNGLTGDYRITENPNEKNSFYYFLRAEGQSGKHDGVRGRHGIGKYVVPKASRIRTFWAATHRASDSLSLLVGQCILKSHTVNGCTYTPDGWCGTFETKKGDDYLPLPVDDKGLYTRFLNDFSLSRKPNEAGLSLVIPFLLEEIDVETLIRYTVSEYFWPILNGDLVVLISNDEKELTVNESSVNAIAMETRHREWGSKILPYINLAIASKDHSRTHTYNLISPERALQPSWTTDLIDDSLRSKIRNELYVERKAIRVVCPIYVQLVNSSSHIDEFEIVLHHKGNDEKYKPRFIREGITIPEDRVNKVRGIVALVIIKKGPLATLLGDSENPAHTEWEKNAVKFKGKYKWGAKTIDFVRFSASKLINLLSGDEKEEDYHLLSDIFYLDSKESEDDVPRSRLVKKRKSKGSEEPQGLKEIPQAKPKTYRLSSLKGGFSLKGPEQPFDEPRRYRVKIAYDYLGATKSRALKKYHINDFSIKEGRNVEYPEVSGVTEISYFENEIIFLAESNQFELNIRGFDLNRDLIVDVRSEEGNVYEKL